MKYLLSICVIVMLVCVTNTQAQNQYTVEGQKYTLNTEVEGTITLLWTTVNAEYRYFIKKDNSILELKNTRIDKKYQEEYKLILQEQTSDASINTEDVKLTTGSLRKFFDDYNKLVDPNYTSVISPVDLKLRLGAFAGITNSVFTDNINNTLQFVLGADLELIDEVKLKRHAMVLRFKQTFENSEYHYSASQFSLNYRFKAVKTNSFDLFINCKFVSYTYINREVIVVDSDSGEVTIVQLSGGDLLAPLTFGIGADIPMGNGFLTFSYNDIFGISVDSNGEFPVDFSAGYKFSL